MKTKIVCFAGNRIQRLPFIFDEHSKECNYIKNRLEEEIHNAIKKGYKHFITTMQIGIDLWAAETVLKFKNINSNIILEANIPYENQATYWSEDQRERYFNTLAECDITSYTSKRHNPASIKRAHLNIVDKSSLLIAAYDGKDLETNYIINHAKTKGLEIIKIIIT